MSRLLHGPWSSVLSGSSAGGGGGGGAVYTPSLDFSDARNSQYAFFLLLW